MFPIETINYVLALNVIGLQFATVAFLALYFLRRRLVDLNDVGDFLAKWGLWLGFLLSLGGSAMTLVHSMVFGLPPCPLCWWQRVFLYPQVVLFALALWKRDSGIANYSIALSVAGLFVALYHHMLQISPSGSLPCPSEGVSCAQIFFLEFGYITYPMMAFTLFAALIVLMLFVRNR